MGRGSRYIKTFYYPYPKKEIEQYFINSLDKLSKAKFVQVSLMIDRAKRRVIIRGQIRLKMFQQYIRGHETPSALRLKDSLSLVFLQTLRYPGEIPYTQYGCLFSFFRYGGIFYMICFLYIG